MVLLRSPSPSAARAAALRVLVAATPVVATVGRVVAGPVPAPAEPGGSASGAFEPSERGLTLPQFLMAAGIVVLVLVAMRTLRRRGAAAARAGADESPRERLERIKGEAAARERLTRPPGPAEGVLDPVTAGTELAAILDGKAARLERLLEDADARIARLESAAEGTDVGARRAGDDPGTAVVDDHRALHAVPPPPSHAPTSVGPAEGDDRPHPGDRRRLAARIHELSASGLDALRIARELDAPLGEVELVLALGPAVADPDPPGGDRP